MSDTTAGAAPPAAGSLPAIAALAGIPVEKISSYQQYLPAVFQTDELIGRLLLAMEAVLSGVDGPRADAAGVAAGPAGGADRAGGPDAATGGTEPGPVEGLEAVLAGVHNLFDPATTRSDFLPWLASWVAITLRADWDEPTRRAFIARIVPLYRRRGTKEGLEDMLKLYTREPVTVDDSFTDPPHFFSVRMTLSEQDREKVRLKQQIARAIIDQEKPAHTFYALQIAAPTMRLPAHLGTSETLLGTDAG